MKREESYEVNALPEPGARLLREEGGRPWGKRAGRCCLALRSGAGPGAQSQRVPLTGHCDFSTLSWVPGHSGATPLLVSVPRGPRRGEAKSGQPMIIRQGDWMLLSACPSPP